MLSMIACISKVCLETDIFIIISVNIDKRSFTKNKWNDASKLQKEVRLYWSVGPYTLRWDFPLSHNYPSHMTKTSSIPVFIYSCINLYILLEEIYNNYIFHKFFYSQETWIIQVDKTYIHKRKTCRFSWFNDLIDGLDHVEIYINLH